MWKKSVLADQMGTFLKSITSTLETVYYVLQQRVLSMSMAVCVCGGREGDIGGKIFVSGVAMAAQACECSTIQPDI